MALTEAAIPSTTTMASAARVLATSGKAACRTSAKSVSSAKTDRESEKTRSTNPQPRMEDSDFPSPLVALTATFETALAETMMVTALEAILATPETTTAASMV